MLVAERSTGRLTHARAADLDRFLRRRRRARGQHLADAPRRRPRRRRLGGRPPLDPARRRRWVVEVREPCGSRQPTAPGRPRPGHPAGRRWRSLRSDSVEPFAGWRAVAGRRRHPRAARRASSPSDGPADPLRLHRHRLADRRLPDRLRPPTSAGDIGLGSAEMPSAGRPVHARAGRDASSTAGVVFAPDHAPHRRVLPRGARAAVRRALPGARRDRSARQRGTRRGPPGDHRRHHRRPEPSRPTPSTGVAHAGDGWTELVITPERGLEVVDGIISGWHEPEASHLLLMEAVAGRPLLEASYDAALQSATTGTSSATSTSSCRRPRASHCGEPGRCLVTTRIVPWTPPARAVGGWLDAPTRRTARRADRSTLRRGGPIADRRRSARSAWTARGRCATPREPSASPAGWRGAGTGRRR